MVCGPSGNVALVYIHTEDASAMRRVQRNVVKGSFQLVVLKCPLHLFKNRKCFYFLAEFFFYFSHFHGFFFSEDCLEQVL
jgi:hypothetical protein